MKNTKVCAVVFFLTTAGGIAIPHNFDVLYPSANLIFTIGIVMTMIISWGDNDIQITYPKYMLFIIATAVIHRVRIFSFPASMLGMDPDGYAIQIARVLSAGDTSAITFGFYSRAPFHILNGVSFGLVTDYPAPSASIVFPIIGGVVIPLLAASFSLHLRPNSYRTVILSGGGASLLGYSVHYSYWPIAQSSGMFLSLFTILGVLIYAIEGDKRWLVAGVITMTGAIYTHKLVAIATTLSLSGALALGFLHPATRRTPSFRRLFGGTFGLLVVLTGVQLFFITTIGQTVVLRLVLPSVSVQTIMTPTDAVNPYTFPTRIFRLSYALLLAIISGFVWVGWFWQSFRKDARERDIFFLGIVATLASLTIFLYPIGVNPIRAIFYSETLLFVLVAVGLYWTVVESHMPSERIHRYAAIGTVLALVATAGISPVAGPDFEGLERRYLTAEEVQAKEWGYRTSLDTIATDAFYASETPPALITAIGHGKRVDTGKFEDRTSLYVNNNFQKERPSVVAHRSCIETLRGPWRLTYDVNQQLDMHYSKVYNSGCVSYFSR